MPPRSGRRIKAVAVDIDGTITDPGRRLSLDAVRALRDVEDRGIPVILASGNIAPTANALAKFIGATGPVVAENGGLLVMGNEMERLADPAPVRAAADYARRELGLTELLSNTCRFTEVCFQETVPVEELRRVVREGSFDVQVDNTGFALHIMPKGMDKLVGIRAAARHLGLRVEELLIIGDGRNDRRMVEAAGIGVAVANAVPEVRAVAAYVCRSAHGPGVVEALRRFVLGGANRGHRGPRSPVPRRSGPARTRRVPRRGRRRASGP